MLNCKSIICCFVVLALLFSCNPVRAEVLKEDNSIIFKDVNVPIYVWSNPQMKPVMIIIAIHGGVLNGQSFDAFARQLAEKGVLFVAPDLHGFGAWYRGNDRFAVDKTINPKQDDADLQTIYSRLKENYPNVPIVWSGESMGANYAVRLAVEKGGGLLLSSAAPKDKIFLDPANGRRWFVFLIDPIRPLDVSPYVKSRLSEDPRINKELMDDSLNRFRFPVGQLFNIVKYTQSSIRMASQFSPDTPVLIIHGDIDRLCSPQDITKFYLDLNVRDKQLVMIPNKGHIHFETTLLDPQVLKVVYTWIDNHAAKAGELAKDNLQDEIVKQ